MIKFEDVSFKYPNGYEAVKELNLNISKGESIAIVGQNGAGKTTTVKLINGLLKPTSGSVIVNGKDTKDFTTAQLSRQAGYVFQNPDDQIFHNTVLEEIKFGPKVLGFNQNRQDELVDFAIKLVGLGNDLDENPYNLSQSVRKFVTIASILAMDTEIIILDEPTAGQDTQGIRILENLLKVLIEKGKTIITITHDMEFVTRNFNNVIVMANSKLIQQSKPSIIFENDELLELSMLKRPFISELSKKLKLEKNILSIEEFVEYVENSKNK